MRWFCHSLFPASCTAVLALRCRFAALAVLSDACLDLRFSTLLSCTFVACLRFCRLAEQYPWACTWLVSCLCAAVMALSAGLLFSLSMPLHGRDPGLSTLLCCASVACARSVGSLSCPLAAFHLPCLEPLRCSDGSQVLVELMGMLRMRASLPVQHVVPMDLACDCCSA